MGEGLQRNGTLRYASVTDLNTAQSEKDAALQKYVSDLSNYWTDGAGGRGDRDVLRI